jgi:hypothetical protein
MSCSYSQENLNREQEEIRLDTETNYKEYKLTKPDFYNKKDLYNNDDDNETPLEFMSSPLQLLKQYTNGNY